MKDGDLLERIVLIPKVMAGKPVIRGTRLPVEYILNLLAHGAKENDILDEYKGLILKIFKPVFFLPPNLLKTPISCR